MNLVFHFSGREYTIYNTLTFDEIGAFLEMANGRDRKLNPLDARSTKRYFEDTDKMVAAILRRCFRMTDGQIAEMDQSERRGLGSAFIKFLAAATTQSSQKQ
jgi:hypothetical protein